MPASKEVSTKVNVSLEFIVTEAAPLKPTSAFNRAELLNILDLICNEEGYLWNSTSDLHQRAIIKEINDCRNDLERLGFPDRWDAAQSALLVRRMANCEIDLFRTKLTQPMCQSIDRMRSARGLLWRMVPEGY
jgi:hypothetical protein